MVFASLPSSNTFWIFSRASATFLSSLFWGTFALFCSVGNTLSTCSKSAKISSVFIISLSLSGSTQPSTWTTSLSLKYLNTWTIASTSLICERNLFHNHSHLLVPWNNYLYMKMILCSHICITHKESYKYQNIYVLILCL